MKKIFSMIAFALIALSANAQVFCDENGTEYKNGTTLTMPYNEDDAQCKLTNLYIKNTTTSDISTTATIKIISMPSGSFSCCFPNICHPVTVEHPLTVEAFIVPANDKVLWTFTEWEPKEYGTCVTEFSVGDQMVTVNFVYSAPGGINEVNCNANVNANVNFNVAGQRVNTDSKGVVISGGKKVVR